jgi:hypothetical protein
VSVDDIVRLCFPNIPLSFMAVGKRLLASSLYHFDYLNSNIDVNHPLRSTPLFTCPTAERRRIASMVISGLPRDGVEMTATGTTPITKLYQLIKEIKGGVAQIPQIPHQTAALVAQELESRAVVAQSVTPAGLKKILDDLGISQLPEAIAQMRLGGGAVLGGRSVPIQQPVGQGPTPYFWKDRFSLLPEGTRVPTGPLRLAWQLYMCGSNTEGKTHPPLSTVTAKDFDGRTEQKLFSKYTLFMKELVNLAVEMDVSLENMTQARAQEVLDIIQPSLNVPQTTGTGRARRMNEVAWSTMEKDYKRMRRGENEEGGG